MWEMEFIYLLVYFYIVKYPKEDETFICLGKYIGQKCNFSISSYALVLYHHCNYIKSKGKEQAPCAVISQTLIMWKHAPLQ